MAPKLSEEQRQAIESTHGGPIEVQDDRTQQTYVLVGRNGFHRLVEDRLRRELQIGFDQAEAGDIAAWNPARQIPPRPALHVGWKSLSRTKFLAPCAFFACFTVLVVGKIQSSDGKSFKLGIAAFSSWQSASAFSPAQYGSHSDSA